MEGGEEIEIVIVGGGISGLATALALHRKGITSVVLERSESLRATGAAIGILNNGWRALDQLGIGSSLRQTAFPIQGIVVVYTLTQGTRHMARPRQWWSTKRITPPLGDHRIGERRCLKRNDLITALANDLPRGTIRFGCHILSLKDDPLTSCPILQLRDGRAIKAKVLIGCDGANSVVANFLELKPTKRFSVSSVRGFTNYPDGHGFAYEFVRLRSRSGQSLLGRIPINDKLVYWFVVHQWSVGDLKVSEDPELIRQLALQSTNGFPAEIIEMITNSDTESISLTQLRYRAPWDLLLGTFRKGTVTVAGDAMHVMGPFLGQGGSCGIEDAVVLARCLASKMHEEEVHSKGIMRRQTIEEALDQYLKERKMRVVRLSTQTYLTGLLLDNSSSLMLKFVTIVLLRVLFRDAAGHARYDCGQL